jgi:aspartyl-tRNA(Asn)/glutamyl-tRNA(Gln) amidotransferase subunit A
MNPSQGAHAIPNTIRGLASAYRSESLLPVEVTKAYLKGIEELNPRLNCFITVLADSALRRAEESERRFKQKSPLGLLDGVPIAVKDLIYIEGVRCTAGSKILANSVAPYDSSVVRRLKASGAILVGTTNLHEFAAGVTNVNPHYGAVRNPWDVGRMSGGSSGGSAVAVASGMAAGAIGTDTGGSARIPAALCGVLGLKPTYGRISRLGVIPLASSLDTVGIIAPTAWDLSVLLNALAGHEKEDITTVDVETSDYVEALSLPFSSARIGVVRNYFHDDADVPVEENFGEFISRLQEMGCSVGEVSLDWISEAYDKWLPIRGAEATAFHLDWLKTSPDLYGEDVRQLLEQGMKVGGVEYVTAVNSRPSYMERFSAVMKDFDFLAVPSTSVPAPKLGDSSLRVKGKEVSVRSALIRPSIPFNYIGSPAVSIPSGFLDGLPLGVQVVGRLFDEAGVLRFANAYEKRFGPFPLPPLHARAPATA